MSTAVLPPVAPPPPPENPDAALERAEPVAPEIAAYRRRLRRRLLGWSAVPVLVVILLALKLLSMPAFAAVSQATYDSGDFDRSVAASDGLGIANVFEPWVRHFDRGTGLALIGVLDDARTEFESALALVPTDHVEAACRVRTDLSLVVEQQGDSAVLDGTFAKAKAFYDHALSIIKAAPAGCFDTPGTTDDPATKKPLDDERSRLEQKQKQAQQQAGGDQGQGQGGSDPGDQGSTGDGSPGSGQSDGDQSGSGGGGAGSSEGSGGPSGTDPLQKLQQKDGDAQKQQQQNNDRNRYFEQNPEQYSGKPW